MENVNLFISLGVGVVTSFILFFLFYKGFSWDNKLSAILTILIVMGGYVPLAVTHWVGMDVFAIHLAFFVMSSYGLGIITSHRRLKANIDGHIGHADTEPPEQGWFHWGPAIIVAFFLTIAVVDSIIITLASKGASSEFMARFLPEPRGGGQVVSTFPGAVSNDYQEKYDQFNSHMAQLVTQRERGWNISNGWQQPPKLNQQTVFSIDVTDKNNRAISGAEVTVKFLRPGNSQLDQTIKLAEGAPGTYGMGVTLPAPGNWEVVLKVVRGEDVHQVKGATRVAR